MTRTLSLLLTLLALATPCAAADVGVDPTLIGSLPKVKAGGNVHGHTIECEGVSLAAYLQAAKAMPVEPLHGAQLARVVSVGARDGYHVAFALAELDPSLGNRTVVLADRCNGAPLSAGDGPWRLVVPGESRPARWIRQVDSIRVLEGNTTLP